MCSSTSSAEITSNDFEKKETLIPALISNLKNPDSRVVNRALDALVVLGPQSIAGLQQSLQDPDIYTRLSAAAALGKLGPVAKASVPGLVACLQDAHPLMREEAAFALGSIGEAAASQASPVMLEMVNDADPNIRQTAKEALKKMGVQPPIRSS